MTLVKIEVRGAIEKFTYNRPNSLIFIGYNNALDGAYFWLKDSKEARYDIALYCDKVTFFENEKVTL